MVLLYPSDVSKTLWIKEITFNYLSVCHLDAAISPASIVIYLDSLGVRCESCHVEMTSTCRNNVRVPGMCWVVCLFPLHFLHPASVVGIIVTTL